VIEKYIIDWREFEHLPPAGSFRAQYPQLQGKRIVLFLGRLHPKKGLDLLLPAFAACEQRDAVLVLAGPIDDSYRSKLSALIGSLNIGSRVMFTGMLSGPQRVAAFADADLFTLPSYQENVGIAVIESLAAGTPVIISDKVNIYPDIAEANVGLVVPMQVEQLSHALTELLTDGTKRAEMSARSRPFVQREYDRITLAKRWGEHYERLRSGYQRSG
jgi:glycosyltransferase involved in cell wall biosynthesis